MRPSSGPAPSQRRTPTPVPERAPRGGLRALCTPHDPDRRTHRAGLGRRPTCSCTRSARGPRRSARIRASGPASSPPAVRALFAADPLAARIPVLLVHGLVDNRSVFSVMRRGLRRRGFAHVCTWNYSPLLTDVARGAADLGAHIERICEQTGHDRVHVVGHSLGGLIARYYVQRQGGDRRVESLVTLGTPHRGSVLAARAPHPAGPPAAAGLPAPAGARGAGAGLPHADDRDLQRPRPGRRCRRTSGRCDHPDLLARNVLFRGVGHMSLPRHGGVVDEVAATLAGRARHRPALGRRRLTAPTQPVGALGPSPPRQ